jgi:hypothetical protein
MGVVTTLAGLAGYGNTDGTGSDARFYYPFGLAVDNAANVYAADRDNNTIRKMTPTGAVTTLAGLPEITGSTDGMGIDALFNLPQDVTVDSAGNVYVADTFNHTIRKVTPAGVVTTLAGLAENPGSADGTGSVARFNYPYGVAVDSAGNVYVADSANHTIRKVTPVGVVTTLSGRAGITGSVDGTWSTARFNYPTGVAVDSTDNVYVADWGSSTIRKMTPGGMVTTLAGLAGGFGSADGTGSNARFNGPYGVGVDIAGNVYVADTFNNTIRKVTPAGVVTTLAGNATITDQRGKPLGGYADGTGTKVRFSHPSSVAVDGAGNVYVADMFNHTIRKGYPTIVILNAGPGFGFNGGQFGFNLTGPMGQSLVVEASSDLTSWLPVWTNTFAGALNFVDPQSGVYTNRFYRAFIP